MLAQVRAMVERILHTDDSAERIAWGLAIGMFVAWTPTIGLQMIIAGSLAWLLGGNTAAAMAIVWITNPYTVVPVYWFNYRIGLLVLGGPAVGWGWFVDLFNPPEVMSWSDYVAYAWGKTLEVFWPMWVGSVFVGLVLAFISYFVTRTAVRRYRGMRAARSRPLAATCGASVESSLNPPQT